MARIWTHGVWTVRPGREDDFVRAWQDMAQSAIAEFDPPERPLLMRDREHPNVFRSFGGWEDAETVDRFRQFIQPHLAGIRELTENVEFYGLDEVPFGE